MMEKMTRCYTCGYEEHILSRVVYCVNCEEAMVHRYCVDPPRHGDEEFDWVCEVCCPRVYKQPRSRKTREYSCSKLDSEAEKRKPRRRLKKLGSHDHQEDSRKPLGSLEEFAAELESLPTPADAYDDQPIGDKEVSPSNDLREMQRDLRAKESLPGTNRTTQKKGSDRRQCSSQTPNGTHEGRGQSFKDQDPLECPPLQEPETDLRCNSNSSPRSENLSPCLPSVSRNRKRSLSLIHSGVNEGSAAHQPTLGVGKYKLIPRVGDGSHKLVDRFLPISRVLWRGTCRVTRKMHGMSVELEVHLSNSANFEVSDVARTLPLPLDLELVDKLSEWPKSFPSGNDIGLYFFPSQASDRKAYDDLLGKMIVDDLILRFTSSDLRLHVFSSLELPKETQRFDGKLYLWGALTVPLSPPSSDKVSVHRPPLPSHSKGGSCLEDDLASNRPTGSEVQSIRKGQGPSDTIHRGQQNAHSNYRRDSGRPSSSLSRPASIPNQADPQKHDHAANGRKLDAPVNPANDCKRTFNRPEKGNFRQQHKQNFGFSPGARQKQKNTQKKKQKRWHSVSSETSDKIGMIQKKQKRWHSPYKKKTPLEKAPNPGSGSQCSLKSDRHHEPPTTSSWAEHSTEVDGNLSSDQSPQSKPHPCQVPSFSQHEMPVNKNWNDQSHPQPCPGFPGAQNAHPQPCPGFPGAQHAHPQPFPGGQHAMPVTGQLHPMQYAGLPGGQHTMPPGYPGGQHAMPVTGQPHPQQYAGFSGGQHTMPPGYPGSQRPLPVAVQSRPQQFAGIPGGPHTMPAAGHSQFQPHVGFPGGQHGMPMTGGWHPQPYPSFPSSQRAMWPPHPQAHANFPGGQQAVPGVGSKANCP